MVLIKWYKDDKGMNKNFSASRVLELLLIFVLPHVKVIFFSICVRVLYNVWGGWSLTKKYSVYRLCYYSKCLELDGDCRLTSNFFVGGMWKKFILGKIIYFEWQDKGVACRAWSKIYTLNAWALCKLNMHSEGLSQDWHHGLLAKIYGKLSHLWSK